MPLQQWRIQRVAEASPISMHKDTHGVGGAEGGVEGGVEGVKKCEANRRGTRSRRALELTEPRANMEPIPFRVSKRVSK